VLPVQVAVASEVVCLGNRGAREPAERGNMRRPQYHPRAMLYIFGTILLSIGCLVPAQRLFEEVAAGRVNGCRTYYNHGDVAVVTFADSRSLILTESDLPDPGRCLGNGTLVEKRSGEMAFRVDGVSVNTKFPAVEMFVIGTFGAGLLGTAIAMKKHAKGSKHREQED
jgi:hypothetical protein